MLIVATMTCGLLAWGKNDSASPVVEGEISLVGDIDPTNVTVGVSVSCTEDNSMASESCGFNKVESQALPNGTFEIQKLPKLKSDNRSIGDSILGFLGFSRIFKRYNISVEFKDRKDQTEFTVYIGSPIRIIKRPSSRPSKK